MPQASATAKAAATPAACPIIAQLVITRAEDSAN